MSLRCRPIMKWVKQSGPRNRGWDCSSSIFSSERNYHNYHNYPRNTLTFYLTQKSQISQKSFPFFCFISVSSVIKNILFNLKLIWSISARLRASLPLIACGDVVMDPLRGDIIQNLIQNLTKFLFRFVSERNYHNYHNYPRNNILTFLSHTESTEITEIFRYSVLFPFLPL